MAIYHLPLIREIQFSTLHFLLLSATQRNGIIRYSWTIDPCDIVPWWKKNPVLTPLPSIERNMPSTVIVLWEWRTEKRGGQMHFDPGKGSRCKASYAQKYEPPIRGIDKKQFRLRPRCLGLISERQNCCSMNRYVATRYWPCAFAEELNYMHTKRTVKYYDSPFRWNVACWDATISFFLSRSN